MQRGPKWLLTLFSGYLADFLYSLVYYCLNQLDKVYTIVSKCTHIVFPRNMVTWQAWSVMSDNSYPVPGLKSSPTCLAWRKGYHDPLAVGGDIITLLHEWLVFLNGSHDSFAIYHHECVARVVVNGKGGVWSMKKIPTTSAVMCLPHDFLWNLNKTKTQLQIQKLTCVAHHIVIMYPPLFFDVINKRGNCRCIEKLFWFFGMLMPKLRTIWRFQQRLCII